jgi:hypothetical protein
MSDRSLEDKQREKTAKHQYYLARREAAIEYQKRYNQEHREKIKAYKKSYREARRKIKSQKPDASKTEKGPEE